MRAPAVAFQLPAKLAPLPRTWLAIVNPMAGFLRSSKEKQAISESIRREIRAEVAFTRGPGHAAELARSNQAEGVAVFGGDGTIGEVVNGMALDRQQLLVLPGGTGNGLARDLGMSSLKEALQRARAGSVRLLDLIQVTFQAGGQARSRLEISTASVGYAAAVVDIANRHFKGWGAWCYPLASTLQAVRQRSFSLWLQVDEDAPTERTLTNVMVNNTRHAGNFRAFRLADPGDGRLEVLLARAGLGRQLLHNVAVLTRSYFYSSAPELSVQALTLKLPAPRALMIDGDLWEGVTEARFEVAPARLQCVA